MNDPRLASIPLDQPFLDRLAARWLAGAAGPDEVALGTIVLPTRRAARTLGEAFLRLGAGRALLLPRIQAVGALDEAPLLLGSALSLPPPVPPLQRLAVLSRLVLAAGGQPGAAAAPAAGAHGADQAWQLARALADLMDDAERAEIDLASRLPELAPEHAEHWQRTLDFLRIVTSAWPQWLAEHGLSNPVWRQMAALRAQAALWSEQPPAGRIWAAGFTGASPALLALLGAVGRLPDGLVVLPGLDFELDAASFANLPASHPQAGLASLLAGLGVARGEVADWREGPPSGRVRTLATVLLPEQALGNWLAPSGPADLGGISRLEAEDQQQEAAAIALVLRDAIERPGRRAALVTPDRALAGRVVVELARYGVLVDDSAGEPLASTPAAVLLRLLARAAAEHLAPVPLLAVLKHPYAALGRSPAGCRRLARALEVACLRGPAPRAGFAGLREALARARAAPRRPPADWAALEDFLHDLEQALGPLTPHLSAAGGTAPVAGLLRGLLEAAESLAANDREAGAERLWAQEDGIALADHLAELLGHVDILPPQAPRVLQGLLDASLAGLSVRSQRALRGRDEAAEHPRIFIWGLLEARLQSVDVAVLGGLSEGVWPQATDPGPWMSRPMRVQAGLPSAERAVGEAAHDFLAAACASETVVLSRPGRRDDAPAVPARWLVRLEAWLQARGLELPAHPALAWLARLDQPAAAPRPSPPPQPRPAVALRPRRLSVTEIETWMRDPYAIHARHVLRLLPLKPLHEPADAADYGTVVHEALDAFLSRHGTDWPADAPDQLRRDFLAALEAAGLRPALAAWWRPRLVRIADWVAAAEVERRAGLALQAVATERPGRATIEGLPGGPFELRGRADRIERFADGRLGLLDYKTGQLPRKADVREGWSSQLVLEAAMARAGGFGDEFRGETVSLVYWRLSGGHRPGEVAVPVPPEDLPELVAYAWGRLGELVRAYDDPAQPYLSHPRPGKAPRFTDYALLARVAEWSAAREDGA